VNVTNKPNYMHEEMKSKLLSRNACYHLVQNLVSSYQSAHRLKYTQLKFGLLFNIVNVTNKPNYMHEEIKRKLHSRNAC